MSANASTSNAPAAEPPRAKRRTNMRGQFVKDLRMLMTSFGDDPNPDPDSVAVMEEILIDYISDVCTRAHRVSTNRGKIKVEDLKFVLRNDPKKLARVEELLYMQEDIKRARAAFTEGDIIQDAVRSNGNAAKGTKRAASPSAEGNEAKKAAPAPPGGQ